MDYLATALKPTQTERAHPDQVENQAGGYVWKVDPWTRLRRFLILGSEGSTYYASERKATQENLACLAECVKEDGVRTVREIVTVSHAGRAPKNDPAIFALAYVIALGDEKGRQVALVALPDVCRIGTHLFQFCGYLDALKGSSTMGRAVRRAVGRWYTEREPDSLAYQLVKYRSRGGWSHRDVLRLAHPKPSSDEIADLLAWAVADGDLDKFPSTDREMPDVIAGFELARHYATAGRPDLTGYMAQTIRDYKLPREAVPTEVLADAVVWDALLEEMPIGAMIRNLGVMTSNGLLAPSSEATGRVIARLGDQERITKARIHPIAVLAALTTYAQGHGARGKGEWNPVPQIVDALDETYELAFGNVEPTGQRMHLALDVSGSMGWGEIAGVPGLTPAIGAGAMAMITARTEPLYSIGAFSASYKNVDLTAKTHLRDVVNYLAGLGFGGTDCSLPMVAAQRNELEVDVFCVYTDNETWAGARHPYQALKDYRQASGIDAKLVVIGMVSNGFSIADPNDAGMLDCVGFDTSTPQVISEFAKGL